MYAKYAPIEGVSSIELYSNGTNYQLKKMSKENKDLKKKNESLAEYITDLKCRSMRDNLVLIGISETVSAQPVMGLMGATGGLAIGEMQDSNQGQNEDQSEATASWRPKSYSQVTAGEDYNTKVWEFCEKVLHIPSPCERLFINRAHRSGAFRPDKPRAIIVKFKDTDSKMIVKNAAKELNLKILPLVFSTNIPPRYKKNVGS